MNASGRRPASYEPTSTARGPPWPATLPCSPAPAGSRISPPPSRNQQTNLPRPSHPRPRPYRVYRAKAVLPSSQTVGPGITARAVAFTWHIRTCTGQSVPCSRVDAHITTASTTEVSARLAWPPYGRHYERTDQERAPCGHISRSGWHRGQFLVVASRADHRGRRHAKPTGTRRHPRNVKSPCLNHHGRQTRHFRMGAALLR